VSGVAVFILVTPAKKAECCQRKSERERETERDMHGGKTGERGGKDEREQERRGEQETLLSHSLVQEEFHCLARHLHGLQVFFYASRRIKQNQLLDNDVHPIPGFLPCNHSKKTH